MKINEFIENDEDKKQAMEQKMESLKLESISSLWYLVVASLKAIIGSKG